MRTRWMVLTGVLLGLSGVAFQRASAQSAYSTGIVIRQVSDFYQPLSPFGYWVEVPRYGWCWYPAGVDSDWRPYANGQWLWSDDGWYWASEEPWAWACYHYGRWVWDTYYGWLWVPGTEWAPAWVSWRAGGEYVGWAPLPPECDFGPGSDVIYPQQVVIVPQAFVFVEHRHFCDLIRPSILILNQTIINKTVNITRIKRVNHVVVNCGPNPDYIRHWNPGRVQEWRPGPGRGMRRGPYVDRGPEQDRPTQPPGMIHNGPGQTDRRMVARPLPARFGNPPSGPRAERPSPPRIDPGRVRSDDPAPPDNPRQRQTDDKPGIVRPLQPPRVPSGDVPRVQRVERSRPQRIEPGPVTLDNPAPQRIERQRQTDERPRAIESAPKSPAAAQSQPTVPTRSVSSQTESRQGRQDGNQGRLADLRAR